jgi:hypothetical protein
MSVSALSASVVRTHTRARVDLVLVLLALAGLILAETPLFLAWCCGPSDLAGLGTFWFVNDFAQYESAMDQGARTSAWLITNRFTPEVHHPAMMFGLYVALGKLAAVIGVPITVVYRLAEVAARAIFVFALAAFLHWLLGAGRVLRFAFVLGLFGMGFGVFAAIANGLAGRALLYTGNGSYESNSVGLLFSPPHVPLALALTLAVPWLFTSALGRPSGVVLVGLSAATAAIALLHPFHLPVLLLALSAYALVWLRHGRALGRAALILASTGLVSVPLLLYFAYTFNLEPLWGATYGSQNLLASPRPWEIPIEYGVVLFLALPGAFLAWRSRDGRLGLVVVWAACMLVMQYLPVPYQRRFGFGLQPALVGLAALGLPAVEAWLRRNMGPRLARAVQPASVGLALATTITILVAIFATAVTGIPMPAYRVTSDDASAAAWLSTVAGPADVIVATWDTSNFLAGRVSGRVLGGHPVATLNPATRRAELEAFFRGEPGQREHIASAYGVTYVFQGARERTLGDLSQTAWLLPAYQHGATTIYTVRRG